MKSFEGSDYKVFDMFNNHWALVTAGNMLDYNTCTVSWGSLGTIWGNRGNGRPVVTIYIHPARYTSDFLKKQDIFTVGFYDRKYRKALAYMGSHSGRDGDKAFASGLTPVPIGDGVTYEEARFTLLCHKIYLHQFHKDSLAGEIRDYYAANSGEYPNVTPDGTGDSWEPHYVIIGEITETDGEL